MTAILTTATRLVPRSDLDPERVGQMFRVLSQHFTGVTDDRFRRDLDEKNWVLLIERAGELVGFSTIRAYETQLEGEVFSVIYSGDTIVAPHAWNSSSLPRSWIESIASLRAIYPRGRYIWLLITSGFRTYRFLPLFWREFYPRYDSKTPASWQQLIRHLGHEQFGIKFDEARGVVRFDHPSCLAPHLAGIPAGRSDDPHIAFFASQNPRAEIGDELVCITELSPQNLTPAGRRMASAIPQW